MLLERVWRFIVRHRFTIANISLAIAFLLVAAYSVFAWDLFSNEGSLDLHQAEIELDEALLLGVLVGGTILAIGVVAPMRRRLRRGTC